MGLIQATLEGAKLRLRPIIMTSLAFGFGVLPLALATGAGSGAQRAIGTGVLGGMISSTFLVILFAPLFYVMIYRLLGKHRKRTTMDPKNPVPEDWDGRQDSGKV
jgi:HAE1 family hydrophobic/amphiphilic exporter-1